MTTTDNPNLSDAEKMTLLESVNGNAWNAACDAIKKARCGKYPPDWFTQVLASGLAGIVANSWAKP